MKFLRLAISAAVALVCIGPAAAEPHSFKLAGVQFNVELPEGYRFDSRDPPQNKDIGESITFTSEEGPSLITFRKVSRRAYNKFKAGLMMETYANPNNNSDTDFLPPVDISDDTFWVWGFIKGTKIVGPSVFSDVNCGADCRLELTILAPEDNDLNLVAMGWSIGRQLDAMK